MLEADLLIAASARLPRMIVTPITDDIFLSPQRPGGCMKNSRFHICIWLVFMDSRTAPIRHMSNGLPRNLAKGGTESTKKHRFESFNERISKLTINPARVQRSEASTDEYSDNSYSFFVDSLLRWKNLNLSENFGSFILQNESKCQTLPQVLHHHDHVFQGLVTHITVSDSASLEPLLDLLVNFARDLGAKFGKHVNPTLTLIVSVVIRSTEVDTLEWGFTCLARLFRYLSRLLLPNVDQVFEIMAPLLGYESQKLYIIRFAAEAISFLVRKAAAWHKKNPVPLDTVLEAALTSVVQNPEAGKAEGTARFFQCGATSLIAKAMTGSSKGLCSSAPLIYERIIKFAAVRSADIAAQVMVEHVTISMIHHTDAAGLEPIIKCMLRRIDNMDSFTPTSIVALTGRLLYILITVRKGSRIRDWQGVFDGSIILLKASVRLDPGERINIHKLIAVVLQSAPGEIVAQGCRDAMDVIASRSNEMGFLPFCQFFNDMGRQKFQEYVLPYFKQFLTKNWQDHRLKLLTSARHFFDADSGRKFPMPSDWQKMAVERFSVLQECCDNLEEFSLFLDGLEVFELTCGNQTTLLQALRDHIKGTENYSSSTPLRSLLMGRGLQTYARFSPSLQEFFEDLWPSICLQANQYGSFMPYLQAVHTLIQREGFSPTSPQPILTAKLIENLRTASHQHRLLSLQILRGLCLDTDLVSSLLDTALTIETSPLNLQTSRFISMQTRNLVTNHDIGQLDENIRDALPNFCFGMLTYRLSQSCEDAIAALQIIAQREVGFRIVSDVAFHWVSLGSCEQGPEQPEKAVSTDFSPPLMAEFECSNLRRLESCAEEAYTISIRVRDDLQKPPTLDDDMGALQVSGARTLALRVLSSIPDIAERRSRYLVPFLLSWAGQDGAFGEDEALETGETSETPIGTVDPHQWGLKDRKALLNVFGHFTNPRALYRSKEVLEALTALLCNGDVQIQRASLKAIFGWKMKELQSFEDHLLNLLDDSRFKDEIARLVEVLEQGSHEDIVRNTLFKRMFLRILYGRTISRTGGSASKSIQTSKRKTVMKLMLRLTDDYIQEFVAIALGDLWGLDLFRGSVLNEAKVAHEYVTLRKQLGTLNMMKNMLESFGNRLHEFSVPLIEAVIYCLLRAKRRSPPREGGEIGAGDHYNEGSLLKATRGLGMQCLNLLAQKFPPHQLTNYLSTIYSAILAPSLKRLSVETAQAVSSTLRLFAIWASSPESVHFMTNYDARTLRCITSCLVEPSCKDEVILFILDEILLKMVESLSKSAPDHNTSARVEHHDQCRRIIQENIDFAYDNLASLFKGRTSKDVIASSIRLLCALAHLMNDTRQAQALLEVSRALLEETSHKVGHRSKAELVQIVERFLPQAWESMSKVQSRRLFNTICGMFGFFRDQKSRETVVRVMHVFATHDQDLEEVAALCEDLNAVAEHKLDEPNFDQRLAAFDTINETTFSSMSAKQWEPVFFNMLFFIKDEEELAIRSNASYALRRFVEAGSTDENMRDSEFLDMTKRVLLPALRRGSSAPSELVRVEYLKILADLVRNRPSWQEINDLRPLLMEDDDEASFFSNILHIQQHRRLRAIRRLAMEARKGNLQSANVAHFLLPLLELFVFDTEATHNLRAEAVLAIGDLIMSLDWPQYKSIFRRYSKLLGSESEFEKSVIKLLSLAVDSLKKASHEVKSSYVHQTGSAEKLAEEADVTLHRRSRLAKSMPKGTTISTEISNSLLPALIDYLHDKEEATVSRRVLVAMPTVQLLQMLSDDQFRQRLPPILTDLCNILRSRAQESRDLTRNTLGDIASLIGPAYFEFILKELRSSLTRGYQLHVLSFTVHSILVTTASIYERGSLDYCLAQIVDIVIDDIFGTTGQEKDAEEYVSKMREVKSNKSFDSLELLAQKATVTELKHLVNPVSSLLEQGFDTRRLRKIDEVLRRIAVGLMRNEANNDRQILVFCHEIIRGLYRNAANSTPNLPAETTIQGKVLLSKDSAKNLGRPSNNPLSKDKLLCFSLDVTRMVLKKHDDLQTPSNLHGFMPIIGDCILGMNEEVQTSALRLLHTIIRVPLRAIDEKAIFFVAECVKILRSATDTDTQVTQSALKLVAAILRERANVQIRDNDLAYVLKRILPDLDEPEKQNVAFGVFKSVMGRKLMLPEVYQAMDRVAVIMVTNQNKNARNLARGAYFQFIMDYPQTKDRFSKQVAFLIGNLEFPHHEGRQSVMEVIHLLLTKSRNDLAQKSFDGFFVPLVMVVVNDESSQCREMAATLLRSLFECSDAEQKQAMTDTLRGWLKQVNEPLIRRAAFQAYALYMETNATDATAQRESSFLLSQLAHTLQPGGQEPANADWELVYVALQNMENLCESFPQSTFESGLGDLWANVIQMLRFPHSWVKFSAARLLGRFLAHFFRSSVPDEPIRLPLEGSGGLTLSHDMVVDISRASLRAFHVTGIGEDLANQCVRNLARLTKLMVSTGMKWTLRELSADTIAAYDDGVQDESDDEDARFEATDNSALLHVVYEACRILRRPPLTAHAESLVPLNSMLQLLAVVIHQTPVHVFLPLISTILLPLQNLTDPDISTPFSTDPAFLESFQSMISNAKEIMSDTQEKVGTTEYASAVHKIRQKVKARREERRTKRVIERVADPELAGRKKQKKLARKIESRKVRGAGEKARRQYM